jgi:deoxyribonucleoside regulator
MSERADITPTLVQVARLYYEEDLSQQEIADRLGVSRSLIALYLHKARERGIVRIEIVDSQDSCEHLAYELQAKANLRHVSVVPGGHISPALTRRAVGGAAARFLDKELQDDDVVGMSWGRTIIEMVSVLAPAVPRNIKVVPLEGESGYIGSYTQINMIVLQVAEAFNGQAYFLHAPMFVGTRELRDLLMSDPVTREVIHRWDCLDVACVGIGAVPPPPGAVVYIGDENIPMLLERGAVGDTSARYFSRKGEWIITELDKRLIGAHPDQLRRARYVVAAAAGVEKAIAVLGAVRTGLISALFIDAELAERLLQILD